MRLITALLILTAALANAQKDRDKPKAAIGACLEGPICITNLRWASDPRQTRGSQVVVAIMGTFQNLSPLPVENTVLEFAIQNASGAIIKATGAYMLATIPPGGRWEFSATTGYRNAIQIPADEEVLVTSATVRCIVRSATDSGGIADTFRFQPLVNTFAPRAVKKRYGQ